MSLSRFLEGCLTLDLEISADGRIRDAGAISGNGELRIRGATSSSELVRRLDEFGRGAAFVVGHNIIAHDRHFIEKHLPGAELLARPVVDTLYLAPLARPERPYHRLIKDYKLVGGELSNPVSDCRLALDVLKDCWKILKKRERDKRGLVSIYRSCLKDSDAPGGTSDLKLNGSGKFLEALGAKSLSQKRVLKGFRHFAREKACIAAINRELPSLLKDPLTRPAVAYSLAWLTVAGTESVLPRWVHRTFPDAAQFLKEIRGTDCEEPGCTYCSTQHNQRGKLEKYFGFTDFRPTPTTSDGRSLQEQIISCGFRQQPLLAILPTGGGKSLCFQLPAIVYNERIGALTIVISPLQALMKDQVENLNRKVKSGSLAAALNGLLTMPERHDVLEGIRLGRFAILYVSPEQLRNRAFKTAIRQREIAAWVFDEAHCISKWGHDFRPDYLYAARFIREFSEQEGVEPAPVACFTATAKLDVREEVVAHFREVLGQKLEVLASDRVDRRNLHYSVEEVTPAQKAVRVAELLAEYLGVTSGEVPKGAAIVYANSRKRTERLAFALCAQGWKADHFHAGLEPPEKKRVQDGFVSGKTPVIVATNAFGMGIDKDNVRLVVHADVPGSIENYLQEAGRAGRDGDPAYCVLLFAKGDLESQFDLASRNRLTQRDISQILGAIRQARRPDTEEVVLSPGELLRVPDTEVSFDERERSASAKVKIAISWLERARFLLRNENQTRVFQGVPAVPDLEAAKSKMERLNLPEHVRRRWLEVIDELQTADLRDGIDADDLAHLPSFRSLKSRVGETASDRDKTATREILRTLDQMTQAGLIKSGIYFTAWVRHKTKGRSLDRLDEIVKAERKILTLLSSEYPDASPGAEVTLSIPHLQERLRGDEIKIARDSVLKLFADWAREGIDRQALVNLTSDGRGILLVRFQVDWTEFRQQLNLRNQVGQCILKVLLGHAERQGLTGERLVRFSLEEIRRAIDGRLEREGQIRDPFNASEKALLFLDEHHVIKLEKGLSIFRQAMTLRVLDEAKGKRYSGRHYAPLQDHYNQRVCQIHAIGRYVDKARNSLDGGRRYIQNYFMMPSAEFRRHYFGGDPKMLERATSRESHEAILESLRNDAQEEIVAAPRDRNRLVLAGPGSGKTRVVVHRCAYLLRIERIHPERILVVCFSRAAMHELRTRLRDLVGDLARQVAVHTYHSLALSLTERSMAARADAAGEEHIDFDGIIEEANRRLRGEEEIVGVEPDELRDRLLAGFEYVLVDEYQDIDARQYELITHVARRAGEDDDQDRRATILAVGDDDQSIFEWRDANVQFLRRFEKEFNADRYFLVENHRSTQHIVDASNSMIEHNRNRMKVRHPIRVNAKRAGEQPGGEWQLLDPVTRGKVSLLEVKDVGEQAQSVLAEVERLRSLNPSLDWQDFAILARNHSQLATARLLFERSGIPVRRVLPDGLPPFRRLREFKRLFDHLKQINEVSIPQVRKQLARISGTRSIWTAMSNRILTGLEIEFGEEACLAVDVAEALHRSLADHQRSRLVGDGVLISTVHSAKGLEFPHVLVLGGGWNGNNNMRMAEANGESTEEERRLYYVAMTRARKTLTLIQLQDESLPFAREFNRQNMCRRKIDVAGSELERLAQFRYTVLGMKDLYIDFAGKKPKGHKINLSLARLQAGDPVRLQRNKAGQVVVLDRERVQVARLSKSTVFDWPESRLQQVREVRVLGMVSRKLDDCAPQYQDRMAVSHWELPILEVLHKGPSHG